jgi:glycosyltransferase involved in cell wall biosynthesis
MIIQVGACPPPYGGVSIFVKRMKEYLDSEGIDNQVWDISNVKKREKNVINMSFPLIPFFSLVKKDITLIHYNMAGIIGKNYIGFFNKFLIKDSKKVLTIHGDCKSKNLFKRNRKFMIQSLNSFDAIICVKKNDKDYLLKQGISSDIYEIPAFIPPKVQEQEIKEISQEAWDFINGHKPIISANASDIVFYNAQDLYGIDMCIDLCANLKKEYHHIGLIFSLPSIKDYKYFEKLKQRIIKNKIENNFLFYTKPSQLYPIIMKSDLFVRPTNTDGDAISIREALYFKIPTVASDIVPRPEGTITFKNRNTEDFILKVKDLMNNYNYYKEKLKRSSAEKNAERIIELYKKLMKHKEFSK